MSTVTNAYTPKVEKWETEIKGLMKDFKFDKNEINHVLESSKAEFKENTTESQKYNIAWKKFYTMSCMTKRERRIYLAS